MKEQLELNIGCYAKITLFSGSTFKGEIKNLISKSILGNEYSIVRIDDQWITLNLIHKVCIQRKFSNRIEATTITNKKENTSLPGAVINIDNN